LMYDIEKRRRGTHGNEPQEVVNTR